MIVMDEDVRFELRRNLPKTSLDSILDAGGASLMILGALGGYLGASNGLDWNKFWSFTIGTPIGLGIGSGLAFLSGDKIYNLRKKRFDQKEESLDEKAKSNGANVVEFSYRENRVECVLRPEYEEKGNIFRMTIDDGSVSDPIFSYQPHRSQSLKFLFCIPALKGGVTDELSQLLSRYIDKGMGATAHGDDVVGEFRKVKKKEKGPTLNERYKEMCHNIIDKNRSDLDTNEELVLAYGQGDNKICSGVVYSGENTQTRLDLFSQVASELMEQSRKFVWGVKH